MFFYFAIESIRLSLPDVPSQIQTLLSLLQVASKFPDGAQATHLTSFSWPSSTVRDCKHTWWTCQSDKMLTMSLPSIFKGLKLCLCKNKPQNHHSSSSRCMLWHQSWRMPDISRRETRPPFWPYAGVHRPGHTYIPNCPLRIKIRHIRHKQFK